jgi:MFS family permease
VLGGSAALVIEGRHAPSVLYVGVPLLVVLAVGFVRLELRHPDPVFEPRFFAVRGFAAANGGIASSNLAFYTVLLATPILLTRHLHWTSLQTGVALALLSAPMVVFSPIGGRLADRLGRRLPAVAGCVILSLGLLPLALAPGLSPYALLPCLSLMGAGVGLSTAGLQASAIEALDPEQAGVAAGVFSTSRYIGSFAGSIALARLLDEGVGLSGFHAVFLIAFAGAVVSVLVTMAMPAGRAALALEPA